MKGKYPFAIIFFDIDPKEIDVNVHPSKKIVKFSDDKVIYRQIKDAIDEHFYHSDREGWQPNINLLKKSINIENKDEKISDLFSDEIIKGDNQKFFSFETHDGDFSDKSKNTDVPDSLSESFILSHNSDDNIINKINKDEINKEINEKEINFINYENQEKNEN